MKRSKSLSLCLMAGSAVALSACGDKEVDAVSFKDAQECAQSGEYSLEDCQEAIEEAREHQAIASPRYSEGALCETEFGYGACTRHAAGYWGPSPRAYLFSMVGDDGRGRLYARPYYTTRQGHYYTADGTRVWLEGRRLRVSEKSMVIKPKSAKVQTRTSVIARGGFGTRSSSRSSWGG